MTSGDLASRGFIVWRLFNQAGEAPLLMAAPNAPGVYCMRSIVQPFQLKAGHSDILYIGSAANRGGLRGRLRQYLHPGHLQHTNLRLFARCCQCADYEVAFTVTATPEASKALEAELLQDFVTEHRQLPPENRVLPRRRMA